MRTHLLFWIGAVILSVGSVCAWAAEPEAAAKGNALEVPAAIRAAAEALPKEVRPEELRRTRGGALFARLPNGAELVLLEKHTAPVATVQAWVRTGAIHEQEWLGAGLSHFCEHLLFKGTTRRPTGALDQEIRGSGGDDNAYTMSERTVYHVTSVSEAWATSFDVLADMLMDSTFPPEETVKEHAVVYKEIERAIDDPDRALWETFDRQRYQVHPYRIPVLGYPERFQRVTREEVFAYYKRRYAPQMTTFVAVGDFSAPEVLTRMARTLGVWKRTSMEEPAIPEEPEQVAPRGQVVRHTLCQVPKLILGYPTVSIRHPDLYALDVLAGILGDGRSSRLYRTVKDTQRKALEIEAFNNTPQYAGSLMVMATVEPDQVDAARSAILEVLEQTRTERPTQAELDRAKRKVLAQRVFKQMTVEGIAEDLGGDWFIAGDLDFSERYAERIQKVTAEEVLAAAQKYIRPDRLNTVVLLPEKSPETPAGPSGTQTQPAAVAGNSVDPAQALRADPEVASVQGQVLAGAPVYEITLRSGLRLVVREDHSLPGVHLALTALGGQRWETAEGTEAGAGNLLAEMLDRGTAKRTQAQIAEEVERLGASLATFGGRNSFGLQLRGLKEDLPALMELGADAYLNSNFPADELEKVRQEVLAQIAQEDGDLFTLNSKVLRPLLFGSHPYGRTVTGTPESVKKTVAADLARLHRSWVQPGNTALSMVGDVTAAQALALVKKHLAAWPQPPGVERPAVPAPEPVKGKLKGERTPEGIEGAVVTLGFRGCRLLDPDREPLDLIGALLSGLGGRLFIAVREEQGLAYTVGARNDVQLDGGAFIFYVQTDEQKVPRCLETIWGEIEKLRGQPVSEKELESVKSYLLGQESVGLQDQADLAQRLALSQLYQEGARSVFDRTAKIRAVTCPRIQECARKYFNPEAWAQATVRPAAKTETK